MHWLPTWKETPISSSVARRAASSSGGGLARLDAELAGQRIGRALGLDRQADDQVEVLAPAGDLEDLLQLLEGVEREGAHAVVEVGLRDRGAALHRMHEGQPGARRVRRHQLDLGDRGHVEAAHAVGRERLDHPRRRVRLNGVEDVAFEVVLEPARR